MKKKDRVSRSFFLFFYRKIGPLRSGKYPDPAGFHAHPVGKSRDIQGVGRKQVFRMPGKVEFGRFAFGQRARPGAVQAYQIPQERKGREKTGFPVLRFKKRKLALKDRIAAIEHMLDPDEYA